MTDRLVACEGGPPGSVGWLRVSDPPPLEIDTGTRVFVLDDADDDDIRYVFVRA